MARTRERRSTSPGRQAPAEAWSPDALLAALLAGTAADRVAALKAAGIIDARGKLTETYKSWGRKVTRTPAA